MSLLDEANAAPRLGGDDAAASPVDDDERFLREVLSAIKVRSGRKGEPEIVGLRRAAALIERAIRALEAAP